MRSIRLANFLSALTAAAAAYFFMQAISRLLAPHYHADLMILVDPTIWVAILVFAYSYLLLMHVGRFDPVVAWAANAWQKADYGSALFRLRLFSWRDRRAPFTAFLLTSANFADRAYAVATHAKLPATDMEEPSYDLDFASDARPLLRAISIKPAIAFINAIPVRRSRVMPSATCCFGKMSNLAELTSF